jgi:chemotaxis protein histidine kinase CheA
VKESVKEDTESVNESKEVPVQDAEPLNNQEGKDSNEEQEVVQDNEAKEELDNEELIEDKKEESGVKPEEFVQDQPASEPITNEEQVEENVEVQEENKEEPKEETKEEYKEEYKEEAKEEPIADEAGSSIEPDNEPQEPVTDNQESEVREGIEEDQGKPDSLIKQPTPKESEVESVDGKDKSERQEVPMEENKDVSQSKDQPEEQSGEIQEIVNATGPLADIQSLIDKIKKDYEDSGALYEDPEFPADDTSLYQDPTNVPEYAKEISFVEWRRPQEITSKAQFVMDGMAPGDIVQGIAGDCWLLGSFCCLATRIELLNNLIIYDEMEYGVVVLQFFKDGEWKPVVVDTRLPYDPKAKKLLYARCERENEFWVCFLEKAYAKLYKSYQGLDGGKMQEGLVDLTGGITEKINVRDVIGDGPVQPARTLELWRAMKQSFQQGYLMGCSLNDKNAKVSMSPEGIIVNHAYGVISIREIQGLKLIRLRNPWGKGEWRGSFSDDDDNWDNYKGLREALGHELKDDGVFWMEFKDWCMNFNKVYISKIFPSTWQQYSIPCAWKGKTNGGRNLSL